MVELNFESGDYVVFRLALEEVEGRILESPDGSIMLLKLKSGFNIGINSGGSAGAGIPNHLHTHIVPRWKEDTNFMPVLFETKVISQSLDELYVRLSEKLGR